MRIPLRGIMLLLLIPILAAAACTRPAELPLEDQLATVVASTLTAAPTWPASPTPTGVPSATVPPIATATTTETAGPSATPTATLLPPNDPRRDLDLSAPDHTDQFESAFTWYTFTDVDASNLIQNGRLQAIDYLTDYIVWWSTSTVSGDNLYAEISIEFGNCSGKDSAGLAVRVGGDQFDRGYAFEFSCDGSYRLRKFVRFDTSPEVLLNWTRAESLQSGSNAKNRIAVAAKQAEFFIFANGTLLKAEPITDGDYASGILALFASAYETPGLTVNFDDLALWRLRP